MTHGTAVGWRWHRCRCDACHSALLEDAKIAWALRQVRRGRDPATRVSSHAAKGRLTLLVGAGMTHAEIARKAGVSAAAISRLAQSETSRISRITHAALLSVPLPAKP